MMADLKHEVLRINVDQVSLRRHRACLQSFLLMLASDEVISG
jgi:hypothetical protein